MNLQFGREICNQWEIAKSREWLVTNGIGGYASGTISGVLTRHYHGLLIAALKPPVARTLFLTKIDETVKYNRKFYDLSTNLWADGTVAPQGYLNIESFRLEETIAVWKFAFSDGLLEKRIWMTQGENTTHIQYTYKRGSQPLTLSLKALVNYRDYHSSTHVNDWQTEYIINSRTIRLHSPETKEGGGICGLRIQAFPDAENLYLSAISPKSSNNFNWQINHTWYQNFALAIEKYRGLDATEDHLLAATGTCVLEPGDCLIITASTLDKWSGRKYYQTGVNQQKIKEQNRELIDLFYSHNKIETAPEWIEQLVLAADQFIVDRPFTNNSTGKTIMAGYPWFTDWGRDTMIALPGLTISTGRYDLARTILRTFAKYINKGMLPNVFPDAGEIPEYNTVDATLWYFEAIRAYYYVTKDRDLLAELFSLLREIIDWHIRGSRYNIKMDDDGLLYAGESGVQLTWMDAKVGNWVVTPRIGKPVEVNALWYNSLVCMTYFSHILSKSDRQYQEMAQKTRSHFSKFWYEEGGYCYDVIDSPDGNDPSFRPNQIFAVSLPLRGEPFSERIESLLQVSQQKMIVDKVGQRLLTSYGLRSLSAEHPDYVGIYGGNQVQRDGSYHQGTTWSWLIGHFVQAHLQVYQNPELARSFLLPMADHLGNGCVGSISEIFDGDAPFMPRGCFAQAWSVAEVIRGWLLTQNKL
jgi:predicted glycogen debranching enzyme